MGQGQSLYTDRLFDVTIFLFSTAQAGLPLAGGEVDWSSVERRGRMIKVSIPVGVAVPGTEDEDGDPRYQFSFSYDPANPQTLPESVFSQFEFLRTQIVAIVCRVLSNEGEVAGRCMGGYILVSGRVAQIDLGRTMLPLLLTGMAEEIAAKVIPSDDGAVPNFTVHIENSFFDMPPIPGAPMLSEEQLLASWTAQTMAIMASFGARGIPVNLVVRPVEPGFYSQLVAVTHAK